MTSLVCHPNPLVGSSGRVTRLRRRGLQVYINHLVSPLSDYLAIEYRRTLQIWSLYYNQYQSDHLSLALV